MDTGTMTFEDAVWALRRRYGSHREVAKHLKISGAHYCQMRRGNVPLQHLVEQGIIRLGGIAAKENEANSGN